MKLDVSLALVFCSVAAWPPSQPEIASEETAVTFSSLVNLVSVPVVVRDREGWAVGNLRQKDFQLADDTPAAPVPAVASASLWRASHSDIVGRLSSRPAIRIARDDARPGSQPEERGSTERVRGPP
jgi:hypothetical protein